MLTDEQQIAVNRIRHFLQGPEKFFLLGGYAGTGKTYCISQLVESKVGRMIFTAPTNKATKVIKDSFADSDYEPQCRTIFSLLGLRLMANGEIKELTKPEDPVDLSRFKAIIIDEASMVTKVLWEYINKVADLQKVKFIFMGDPAQLPPVKEIQSPVWEVENRTDLITVMRHDNQILTLATAIRKVVDHPAPCIQLKSDNDGEQGVWRVTTKEFDKQIINATEQGKFSDGRQTKAIAWRNVTVDRLNMLIRNQLFPKADRWVVGDRLIILEPVKGPEGNFIASTDDEGTVIRVEVDRHPIYSEFQCYFITITLDDNRTLTLKLLHPSSAMSYNIYLKDLLMQAKGNGRYWKQYWEFKESFNQAKYGYAITTHRAQGSTYETAFVDANDILQNRSRNEAFRCLYVACTRPKKRLILA